MCVHHCTLAIQTSKDPNKGALTAHTKSLTRTRLHGTKPRAGGRQTSTVCGTRVRWFVTRASRGSGVRSSAGQLSAGSVGSGSAWEVGAFVGRDGCESCVLLCLCDPCVPCVSRLPPVSFYLSRLPPVSFYGKKTPGGAGTHTGHTRVTRAHTGTPHIQCRRTSQPSKPNDTRHTRTTTRRPKPWPSQQPQARSRPLPAADTEDFLPVLYTCVNRRLPLLGECPMGNLHKPRRRLQCRRSCSLTTASSR